MAEVSSDRQTVTGGQVGTLSVTAPRQGRTWLALVLVAMALVTPLQGWLKPRAAGAADTATGGTLRVAMLGPAFQGFDPTTSYTLDQLAVLRLLQRTLLSHQGVTGFEGTRLVPDLASELPTVSADGLTWTFRIRPGVHYAPPLQDVEVTAGDFVRAFERVPVDYGPGMEYLPGKLEGFAEFAKGASSSISGALALDDHTLQLRTTVPDRSFAQQLTLPFAAPIPPSPRPGSTLGIATDHDFKARDGEQGWAGPVKKGFGPFQSATGPYMIEGADQIDYRLPASEQAWPPGFTPSWWPTGQDDKPPDPGRLVLVRNPSWDASSDPVRPAYVDRVEIAIQPVDDPYGPGLDDGQVDAVIGGQPSPDQLSSASRSLRSRITRTDGNGTSWVMLNLLQPPFDDVHVRRAFAMALDRRAMTDAYSAASGAQARPASSIVPDAVSAGLLSGGSAVGRGSAADARAEMAKSRYWGPKGCLGAACRTVVVGGGVDDPGMQSVLRQALATVGLRSSFVTPQWERPETNCINEPTTMVACVWAWFYDYPDAQSMFDPFDVRAGAARSASGLGMTADQLRAVGSSTREVPSIRTDAARCAAALETQAVPCWAQLDRRLTDVIVAVVPFSTRQSVRAYGARVTSAPMDQATGEYALDRMIVRRG